MGLCCCDRNLSFPSWVAWKLQWLWLIYIDCRVFYIPLDWGFSTVTLLIFLGQIIPCQGERSCESQKFNSIFNYNQVGVNNTLPLPYLYPDIANVLQRTKSPPTESHLSRHFSFLHLSIYKMNYVGCLP
jgi:hypothetical protein